MTLTLVVPDYSGLGIEGPYFGDRVYEELRAHKGKAEKAVARVMRFPDGDSIVDIDRNLGNRSVYIVHSIYAHPDTHNMIGLKTIDAVRRGRSGKITMFEPYNPDTRQDSRWGRQPISGRLIADLYECAGMDVMLMIDPHSKETEGFFKVCEPIPMARRLATYVRDESGIDLGNTVVLTPDDGAYKIAKSFAERLGLPFGTAKKTRIDSETTHTDDVLFDVEGKTIIFRDDVIGTGSTMIDAARAVQEMGARSVYACATHLGLYNDARERLMEAGIKVIATNSIPQSFSPEEERWFETIEIEPVIAEVIARDYDGESISGFFRDELDQP